MTRIQKVKKLLGKNFDALLVSSIPNIIYLTGLAGFSNEEREAYLLVTKAGNYIFTDGRYFEVVKKIKAFRLVEISANKNFEQALKEIVVKEKIEKLAIDEDNIKVTEHIRIKKVARLCSDENLIEGLRAIKDDREIENVKKACKLGDQTFKHILSEIRIGITEKNLVQKIEMFILNHGAQISFRPIVAFGENSSSPHHVSTDKKLKKNEIVLLDFGVKTNNYCSDMTRTVFFGKANREQKKIYRTVLESQTKAIELLKLSIKTDKPITGFDLDKTARMHIESEGYPSIPHSLGHGIGLEVHEKPSLSPKSKETLTNGMIFSIEPGIYIPGFGGIRIEDLVLVTTKEPQIITRANCEIIEL
jgi:Xaa-Pro aminopeptidase